MKLDELRKATLYQVVAQTLVEYLHDCQMTPYNGREKDRCGYIGQILDKVEEREVKHGL